MGWCLPTLLPEPAGRAVQAALEAKGARFHFGPLATAVDRTDQGYQVTLNNGETINADAVLSAVGVRPRTDLAAAAGIETGRGIKTDRMLKTSADGVYALGDCAEVAGQVLVYVAPLLAAGRALAATLAGTDRTGAGAGSHKALTLNALARERDGGAGRQLVCSISARCAEIRFHTLASTSFSSPFDSGEDCSPHGDVWTR